REDLLRFEGNAQGLRILARLEMARERGGMRLTTATIGAFCKYPRASLLSEETGTRRSARKFGFFQSEREVFREAADRLGLLPLSERSDWWCRHPLAFLVEAADDICYQILDLEAGYRLGKVRFDDARDLLGAIAADEGADAEPAGDRKSAIGHLRARAIDVLVREVADLFLREEDAVRRGVFDESLVSAIPSKKKVDAITELVAAECYRADEVLEIEIAGYEVIGALLERFVAAALRPSRPEHDRIRARMPELFLPESSDYAKILRVTDFVSGMTDSYAVSLFRRFGGISLSG
ncbi:MAG: dNTP triphosphohydrolase, partial [Candidatus Latescibacterota bacterium]